MTLEQALNHVNTYEEAMHAYQQAMSVLTIDGSTAAPKRSAAGRAKALSHLSGATYQLTVNQAHREALETILAAGEQTDDLIRRRAQLLMERLDELTRIPRDEYMAYQALQTEAASVWHEAKQTNQYALFAPYLKRMFDAKRSFAAAKDSSRPVYDVMLDTYEKGADMATLDPFFSLLRRELTPLILEIGKRPAPDMRFLQAVYPKHEQLRLFREVWHMMGVDPERCSLAETEHPYTHSLNKWDVRVTTNIREQNLAASLCSLIHESGHALYELGGRDELQYTVLAGGVTMGVHESQSRFYENLIARSLPFAEALLPQMQTIWPSQLMDVTPDMWYAAVNRVTPSLIRTQADELTYPMHIMIRYELEKQLVAGTLSVQELPAAWNEMYRQYLGVEVPDDTNGVLQDVHWADGLMGYFPSYALGTAYSAQMLRHMEQTVDVWTAVRSGDLSPVTGWLRERLHQHGRLIAPETLLPQVLGGPFDPSCYVDYLKNKYSALYQL